MYSDAIELQFKNGYSTDNETILERLQISSYINNHIRLIPRLLGSAIWEMILGFSKNAEKNYKQ